MDNYDLLVSLYTLYVSLLIYENLSDDEEELVANNGIIKNESDSAVTPLVRNVQELPSLRSQNFSSVIQGPISSIPSETPVRKVKSNKNLVLRTKIRKIIIKKKKIIDTNKKKRKRTMWVRESNLDRNEHGYFVQTFEALKQNDPNVFFQHTRMSRNQYDNLLKLVTEGLTKKSMRPSISADCRLAITLSYLSQGLSQQYLAETFKAGRSSIREIILETCAVIWNTLSPLYVVEPSCEDYLNNSKKIYEDYGIPNCVGAVDEKYIHFTCPPRKGISKELTMEFLAACDPFYCFTYVGVSSPEGDTTDFETKIMSNGFSLPADSHLPGSDIVFPYYFVANTNFPLKKHVIRPYPEQRIPLDHKQIQLNRRLPKVYRMLENCIGVLVARWKVLQSNLHYLPENIKTIVLATVALHNYIQKTPDINDLYCPDEYTDWEDDDGNLHLGGWREGVQVYFKSGKLGSNNPTKYAITLRDQLAEYLSKDDHFNFVNIEVADSLEFLQE